MMKYEKTTQRFIEAVDKDNRKWRKPWKGESKPVNDKGCVRQWVNTHSDAVGKMNELLNTLGVKVVHGDNAYYKKDVDSIMIPGIGNFNSVGNYCATMLHELIHWTGTKDRCNRLAIAKEEDYHVHHHDYALEEIVAEIGSAILCKAFGLRGDYQQCRYVNAWLLHKTYKQKMDVLEKAIAQAETAVKYIQTLEKRSRK